LSIGQGGTVTRSSLIRGLLGVTSLTFTISPAAAAQLVFTCNDQHRGGGDHPPAVEVTARDAFGNVATGFTGNVTLGSAAIPPGGR